MIEYEVEQYKGYCILKGVKPNEHEMKGAIRQYTCQSPSNMDTRLDILVEDKTPERTAYFALYYGHLIPHHPYGPAVIYHDTQKVKFFYMGQPMIACNYLQMVDMTKKDKLLMKLKYGLGDD